MLTHVLLDLWHESHKAAHALIRGYTGGDPDDVHTLHEDMIVRRDGVRTAWSSGMVHKRLAEIPHRFGCVLLWEICRRYDLADESDSILRDFVEARTGIRPEPVPFMLTYEGFRTRCASNRCTGALKKNQKETGEVVLSVDTGTVDVILPLTGGIRDSLLRRLRETAL